MEIETRMGLRVRSNYEDVVAWINSDPPGVPYPKNRKAIQALDSHVYGQLTASLSTEATRTIADEYYRRGPGGPGGGPGRRGPQGGPQGGPGGSKGPAGGPAGGPGSTRGTPGQTDDEGGRTQTEGEQTDF